MHGAWCRVKWNGKEKALALKKDNLIFKWKHFNTLTAAEFKVQRTGKKSSTIKLYRQPVAT